MIKRVFLFFFVILIITFNIYSEKKLQKKPIAKKTTTVLIIPDGKLKEFYDEALIFFKASKYEESNKKLYEGINFYGKFGEYQGVKLLLIKNFTALQKYKQALNLIENLEKEKDIDPYIKADNIAYKAYVMLGMEDYSLSVDLFIKSFKNYNFISDKELFKTNLSLLWDKLTKKERDKLLNSKNNTELKSLLKNLSKENKNKIFLTNSRNYKIGVLLSLTGEKGEEGTDILNSINLIKEKLSKKYNVKFDLIIKDTASSTLIAIEKVKELIYKDKVDIIFGPITSEEIIAISGYIDNAKIPMITPTANKKDINKLSKYIFLINSPKNDLINDYSNYILNNLKIKKLQIISSKNEKDYNFALNLKNNLENKTKNNYKIIENTDSISINSLLSKKNDEKIIFLSMKNDELKDIFKKYEFKNKNFLFISEDFLKEEILNEIKEDTLNKFLSLNSEKNISNRDTLVNNFIENYKNKYNKEPQNINFLAFDAFNILIYILSKNVKDSNGFIREINLIKNFPICSGIIDSFRENIAKKKINSLILKNGKIDYINENNVTQYLDFKKIK